MLNDGYEVEERPSSFLYIDGGAINRRITQMNLTVVKTMRDAATRTRVYAAPSPKILLPGESEDGSWTTLEGYDAEGVEQFQIQALKNPEAMEIVRAYEEALELAFDEYNMQMTLGRMQRASESSISVPREDKKGLSRRLEELMGRHEFSTLDSAYYGMGNRFFGGCAKLYEALEQDDFGKDFILTPEQVQEAMNT